MNKNWNIKKLTFFLLMLQKKTKTKIPLTTDDLGKNYQDDNGYLDINSGGDIRNQTYFPGNNEYNSLYSFFWKSKIDKKKKKRKLNKILIF